MKPVVIIAIAVGCSIAGTIGVLIAWQGIATMQAQEAYEEIRAYEQEMESVRIEFKENFCNQVAGEKLLCMNTIDLFDYLEYELETCESFDIRYTIECRSREKIHFLNALITNIESLTPEQREYFGFDSTSLEEWKSEYEFQKNGLDDFLEKKKEFEKQQRIEISAKCDELKITLDKYDEYMARLGADYTAYDYNMQKMRADERYSLSFEDANYFNENCNTWKYGYQQP